MLVKEIPSRATVNFYSDKVGAYASNGVIYFTSDGAKTWTQTNIVPNHGDPKDMRFVDEKQLLVIPDESHIKLLKSDNIGTFTEVWTTDLSQHVAISGMIVDVMRNMIWLPSKPIRAISLRDGIVLRSLDSGINGLTGSGIDGDDLFLWGTDKFGADMTEVWNISTERGVLIKRIPNSGIVAMANQQGSVQFFQQNGNIILWNEKTKTMDQSEISVDNGLIPILIIPPDTIATRDRLNIEKTEMEKWMDLAGPAEVEKINKEAEKPVFSSVEEEIIWLTAQYRAIVEKNRLTSQPTTKS